LRLSARVDRRTLGPRCDARKSASLRKEFSAAQFCPPESLATEERLAEIANSVDEHGCRIRVPNEAGENEILAGVASARRRPAPGL
jgi:hypothetical protein